MRALLILLLAVSARAEELEWGCPDLRADGCALGNMDWCEDCVRNNTPGCSPRFPASGKHSSHCNYVEKCRHSHEAFDESCRLVNKTAQEIKNDDERRHDALQKYIDAQFMRDGDPANQKAAEEAERGVRETGADTGAIDRFKGAVEANRHDSRNLADTMQQVLETWPTEPPDPPVEPVSGAGLRPGARQENARAAVEKLKQDDEAKKRKAEKAVIDAKEAKAKSDSEAQNYKTLFKGSSDPKVMASAKGFLDNAIKENPNHVSALRLRAMNKYNEGDCPGAAADAGAVLGRNPADKKAVGIMQLCHAYALPKPQTAGPEAGKELSPAAPAAGTVAGLKTADAAPPAAQSAYFASQAAQALLLRDYERALAFAKRAGELGAGNPDAWRLRAIAHDHLKNYKEAVRDAEEGLKLYPRDKQLLNVKAFSQNKDKDYKGALATAEAALSYDPNDASAWMNRAYALAGLGDREGMLEAMRRAAALDSRFNAALQAALRLPEAEDPALLFLGDERSPAPAPAAPARGRRLGVLALFTLVGGAIVAIGLSSLFKKNGGGDGLIDGKYELRAEIGQGGMGVVFEGFDVKLQRKVAVKRMRPELKADPGAWERFVQEARAIAKVTHPYIVSIHDVIEEEGELYMIFDFVEGGTLASLLGESKRLPLGKAKSLFNQICQAVDCAHRNKILHRDLKPANIMVDRDGNAKVMDFGVARQAKDTLSRLTSVDISGTPAYMAPEQHLGQASRASDIFALGVCFYEALTGELPFPGPDFLAQKQLRKFTPPSRWLAGLPGDVDLLLAAALEPDPEKRIADAAELSEDLGKL